LLGANCQSCPLDATAAHDKRLLMKIAYLSSQVTQPGSPIRRSDAFEHDYMMRALRPEFAERGMDIEDVCWDESFADWASFDAALIGTTWDYWDRQDEFLSTLEMIESQTHLFNPSALVRWNSNKTYLKDLASRGANLIPTLWIDHMSEASYRNAFSELGETRLVFKRQVGAGASGQHLLNSGDPAPKMPHPMMVQPFLPTIQTEGELSFIFIGGELSHALIKRAKPGDYRIQSTYGGQEETVEPSRTDLHAARAVLETLDEPPLYARVDMLRHPDGSLLLMELELIEPYLYPEQGARLGERLAKAVEARLKGR
jgi:glutathione synthase/RimK-type ligase-like ATP-grasp enzyme